METLPADSNIPRFFLFQLSSTYSVEQLQRILHHAELEEHVATQLGEPDAGFWQQMAEVYRAAIKYGQVAEAKRRARAARGRHLKPVKAKVNFDEIKARIDIVEFIGRYVPLKRSGKGYVGLCPFHNEKTASFWVWPGVQGFRCWGCGAKGDVITFAKMINDAGVLG